MKKHNVPVVVRGSVGFFFFFFWIEVKFVT